MCPRSYISWWIVCLTFSRTQLMWNKLWYRTKERKVCSYKQNLCVFSSSPLYLRICECVCYGDTNTRDCSSEKQHHRDQKPSGGYISTCWEKAPERPQARHVFSLHEGQLGTMRLHPFKINTGRQVFAYVVHFTRINWSLRCSKRDNQ